MTLFKYPVLKNLASYLSQNSPSYLERDTVLPVTTTGKNPPLFLVHPASGLGLHYLGMKEYMSDCPVYAINNPRFGYPENAFASVEEMAACYVEMIHARYPEGPLHVGGWSFGGVVAFEIAQQFMQRGREIATVVLIDSYKLTERDAKEAEEKAHRQLLEQMELQSQQILQKKSALN